MGFFCRFKGRYISRVLFFFLGTFRIAKIRCKVKSFRSEVGGGGISGRLVLFGEYGGVVESLGYGRYELVTITIDGKI